jgi:hypothetical protein
MVQVLARYASRYSIRALDLTVDSSVLWTGAALAIIASFLLAFVPRLPSARTSNGTSRTSGGSRITGSATGRLRIFAVTQIAASFILLTGAAMLLKTLLSLQAIDTGLDTRRVLAINLPVMSYGRTQDQVTAFYREAMRRIREMPSVDQVALGSLAPWRDAGTFGPGFQFTVDGRVRAPGEEDPRGRFRSVSSGFFASLGIPLIAGRDFNDLDRRGSEAVVIVSQSLASRMFPKGDAVNRHLMWTDPVMTIYQPFGQETNFAGRLFVHAHSNPYTLVSPIRRIMHDLSADQPVERAATLEDIRAEVLAPDRLNTLVFGVFAAVALAIALVGVAGVLAFSVSGRIREFGVRLAIGAEPRHLLTGVIAQGAVMALVGVAVGAAGGFALARVAGSYFEAMRLPGAVPIVVSAAVLLVAAIVASLLPAVRAARVDVIQALRAD